MARPTGRRWLAPLAVLALAAATGTGRPSVVQASTAPGGCAVVDAASDTAAVTPEGFVLTAARLVDPAGGVTELCLWVADTPERQARGLMHVTDLGGADGMVFVFDEPTETRFYMWQTPRPLTIAFFDDAGRLVGATEMKPCLDGPAESCARHASDAPYRFALEVPLGRFDELLVDGALLELGRTVWLSPVPDSGTEDNQTGDRD